MNIVFEINHPAQAHLFKNTIKRLENNGHLCRVFIKENQVVRAIFDHEGIDYVSLGYKGNSLFLKVIKQLKYICRVFKYHKREHYDFGVGVSVTLSILGVLTSIKSVIFDDDDKKATPIFSLFSHNIATVLFRPIALSFEEDRSNTIYYNGYHELAYLHPALFNPDISVLHQQGLQKGELFFLIRLVALNAHHDIGKSGISDLQLLKLVRFLKCFGRVILIRENDEEIPEGAEKIYINPSEIHHLMCFSKLIISDGQTMCSEASCLGVPSIRINDFVGRISYLEEQEKKWGLTFGYRPNQFYLSINKIGELIDQPRDLFAMRRDKMVSNSIDVTSYLVSFIENWPKSFEISKKNSNKSRMSNNK